MTPQDWIAVCRPLLPPAPAVAAYIARADAARFYSNRGPLVVALEQRLSRAFGQPGDAVRLTSSGTSAIEAAILASAGPATPDRPLALMPSYTFAATALAAERCGYRVRLLDADPVSWGLDPAAARNIPGAGLVIPVGPYGRMPDLRAWEVFQADSGIAVVADAAAATEALMDDPDHVSASVPVALSFHATKSFSTAEGGAVVWADAAGLGRVAQVSNFGFHYSRECRLAGLNAKLSEYHAAVGLAMLDGFAARRADWARAIAAWQAVAPGLPGRLHSAPDLASVYVIWEAPDAAAMDAAETALTAARIETRRWYMDGLHRQRHFAGCAAGPLPVTETLGARLLGLPMAHDLAPDDVARCAEVLQKAL